MAKRDPIKTARNKEIARLKEKLNDLLPKVLSSTDYNSVHELHGVIGGKNAIFINIKNAVFHSPDEFITSWLQGFCESLKKYRPDSRFHHLKAQLDNSEALRRYLGLFLTRTFLNNFDSLTKRRPEVKDASLWIGQNNANYGLLVTPRFADGNWENDKSEIRHFNPVYWSIGHVLETGFVVPGRNNTIPFATPEQYLTFFTDVLVRNSGSPHDLEFSDIYKQFVLDHKHKDDILLLIPEFRYGGLEKKHIYRLDFSIIDVQNNIKIGLELSPWSSHGHIAKTSQMTNTEINAAARDNFEREMQKHKDFFWGYGINVLIYTDQDLQNKRTIFEQLISTFTPLRTPPPINHKLIRDFLNR